jgi:hypothetical protein
MSTKGLQAAPRHRTTATSSLAHGRRARALAIGAGVVMAVSLAVCGSANAWPDIDAGSTPGGVHTSTTATDPSGPWGPDLAELDAAFWAPADATSTLGITEMYGAFWGLYPVDPTGA